MAQCGESTGFTCWSWVFMLVILSSNFLFHYDMNHIKEGKVSFLATPLCSIYAAHLSIIQPTLSKTERWVKEGQQVWSQKRSNQDFYHLNDMFPNFTYCTNCDLFTDFICEIFSFCKRIYSWQELRPNYESVLSVKCTPFQGISHFSFFSLHGGLQHITRPSGYIGFLSVLKLCIKLHLADTVDTV